MLPKEYRFPLKTDLNKIKQTGKVINTPYFNLLYERQPAQKVPLFAVVSGLKVSKKAFKRNKLKRQILSGVREELTKIDKSANLIFFMKKPIIELKYQDLKKIVINSIRKTGLLINL